MTDDRFAELREAMVRRHIAARGIDDPLLLDAMRAVPRHCFVPPGQAAAAYSDGPLPIGDGQTISQPYIVALMIAAAEVGPDDRVLEVGGGSGYAAAVLGRIASEVVSVERIDRLAQEATARLAELGAAKVTVVIGDGTLGHPPRAPYDAILVAAAAPQVPQALLDQLKDGGRLIIPLGGRLWGERLVRLTRHGDRFNRTDLGRVRFVPLIGG